jgi:hypothetical protein
MEYPMWRKSLLQLSLDLFVYCWSRLRESQSLKPSVDKSVLTPPKVGNPVRKLKKGNRL